MNRRTVSVKMNKTAVGQVGNRSPAATTVHLERQQKELKIREIALNAQLVGGRIRSQVGTLWLRRDRPVLIPNLSPLYLAKQNELLPATK